MTSLYRFHDTFWSIAAAENLIEGTEFDNVLVIIGSFFMFGGIFGATWLYSSSQKSPRFYFFNGPPAAPKKKRLGAIGIMLDESAPGSPVAHPVSVFSFADKVDFASRPGSFIHGCIALYVILTQTPLLNWARLKNPSLNPPTQDFRGLEWTLCISVGYFMMDLVLVVVSRMNLWVLFTIHHVAALIPLLFSLFKPECGKYVLLTATFFHVEYIVPFNNTMYVLECLKLDKDGKLGQKLHRLCCHALFWLWLPTRLVLPPYLCYYGLTSLIWETDGAASPWQCGYPCLSGGFGICFFCYVIFFGPGGLLQGYREKLRRWYPSSSATGASDSDATLESPKKKKAKAL